MEGRLIALERSAKELLAGQKTMRDDFAGVTATLAEFKEIYVPYLKIELEKRKDRAELRRAIIKHGTVMAVLAVIGFVSVATWDHVLSIIHGVK